MKCLVGRQATTDEDFDTNIISIVGGNTECMRDILSFGCGHAQSGDPHLIYDET